MATLFSAKQMVLFAQWRIDNQPVGKTKVSVRVWVKDIEEWGLNTFLPPDYFLAPSTKALFSGENMVDFCNWCITQCGFFPGQSVDTDALLDWIIYEKKAHENIKNTSKH